jgi:hypothetical protein
MNLKHMVISFIYFLTAWFAIIEAVAQDYYYIILKKGFI